MTADELGQHIGDSSAIELGGLLAAIQERMAAGDTHAVVRLYERGSMLEFGVLRTDEAEPCDN